MNTTFEIGDAENLKLNLQNLSETLNDEWSIVISSWQNLQANWNDLQRNKFDDSFQRLLSDYRAIEKSAEKAAQQLSEQIQIAQKQNEKINQLKK